MVPSISVSVGNLIPVPQIRAPAAVPAANIGAVEVEALGQLAAPATGNSPALVPQVCAVDIPRLPQEAVEAVNGGAVEVLGQIADNAIPQEAVAARNGVEGQIAAPDAQHNTNRKFYFL